MVSENIKTAHVFKKYNIDFCCGGGISIEKACEKKNVDISLLAKELLAVDEVTTKDHDYNSWELDVLVNHIVDVHHTYVSESIPLIIQYSDRVAKVHGENHPETVKINELFHEVAAELNAHMQKEEGILFPYIMELAAAKKAGQSARQAPFGTVNNPIHMMKMEHENAGGILKNIDNLSSGYTPPEGACNTYRALYSKLSEFEQDLHLHIHLENNILFPKSSELEQSVVS